MHFKNRFNFEINWNEISNSLRIFKKLEAFYEIIDLLYIFRFKDFENLPKELFLRCQDIFSSSFSFFRSKD